MVEIYSGLSSVVSTATYGMIGSVMNDDRDHVPLQGRTFAFIREVIRRVRAEYTRCVRNDEYRTIGEFYFLVSMFRWE